MPYYTYECKKCGHRQKYMQKITAEPLKECWAPTNDKKHRIFCNREDGCQSNCEVIKCGGELHRIPVATGRPYLKGGGWEKDGYK